MVKASLENMIAERSIKDSHSTLSLLLTVLLKYGIAPIACIYLGYVLLQKDAIIEKHTETFISLVRDQTTATIRQTAMMENLGKNIEANTKKLEDIDRKQK